MIVYLAYTQNQLELNAPKLLRVYKKSSYQRAYDWLADLAERHHPGQHPIPGTGNVCVYVVVSAPYPGTTTMHPIEKWWLERHEVV